MAGDEKRIIIDEDWKAQVEREREEARVKAEQAPQPADAAAGATKDEADAIDGDPLFLSLVQSLVAQALFALGIVAPQGATQVTVDIEQARYLIDTLIMLREKTEGRRTPAETGQLAEAVADLQRAYVVRAQQAQEAALKQSGVDPHNLKK